MYKHCNRPTSQTSIQKFFVSIFAFLQVFLSCQNMACDHLFVYCCTYWNVNLLDKLIGLSHVNLIDLDQVGRQANRLIIVARYTLLTATNCAIKIRAVAAVCARLDPFLLSHYYLSKYLIAILIFIDWISTFYNY